MRRALLLSFVFCLLTACERKSSTPPATTVNVRCVLVLNPNDTPGGANNIGCRLSWTQVMNYMQALNNYGARYGNNASFVYNTTQEVWQSTNLNQRPYSLIDWWSLDVNPNSTTNDPNYDDTKIQIYFVGDIRDPNAPGTYNANTTDPLDGTECTNLTQRPHIFSSDRAFLNNGQPYVALADRCLEHEMCHFLIRQKGPRPPYSIGPIPVCPAFPAQGQGRYDVVEHDANANATHLMRRPTPHGQIAAIDTTETSGRVNNHQYLLP